MARRWFTAPPLHALTGFTGLHMALGAIGPRWSSGGLKGHFTAERHFASEGVAWYWHFVDVVWFGLFIFVCRTGCHPEPDRSGRTPAGAGTERERPMRRVVRRPRPPARSW